MTVKCHQVLIQQGPYLNKAVIIEELNIAGVVCQRKLFSYLDIYY